MKDVFAKLLSDFLSTIVFLVLFAITGDVLLATVVAVLAALAQLIYARIKGIRLDVMTWASLALVIALGAATLLTHDPRFVLLKPSIGHFAIGGIMLRKNWMLRYMPPLVVENAPDLITLSGYAWAALMFVLGAGVIAVAMTGNIWLWGFYVGVIAMGAKVVAFAIQYIALRIVIARRLRKAAATA